MRNKGKLQALCLFFLVYIKSTVSLDSNGLYRRWDEETNRYVICKEILVKRGYEAVPCTENEAEDSVRKCPPGKYQPDQTSSSSSPQCIAEPECTEEEIKKDSKCVDDYCWTVCICSLEVGKCGLNPLNCMDIKNIQCMGEILQDCSCTPKLPTSPPTRSILSTLLNPINPDRTAKTSSLIPTDFTKFTKITGVTTDGTDTGAKGNEAGYLIPVIIVIVLVILSLVVFCIIYVRKRCSNRPKKGNKENIEMLETDPTDKNVGISTDKVSEVTDSGVCGLSKGSHEYLELMETDSNSINVSNGSEMESDRNINNSVGDDHDAARGQSLSQVEVHNYPKPREEPTLAEEEDSFRENDPFLSQNEHAVISLEAQKIAVVIPLQTARVEDSPTVESSENQPLRGEDFESGTGFNFSMNWNTLGSSIYRDSTNQQND